MKILNCIEIRDIMCILVWTWSPILSSDIFNDFPLSSLTFASDGKQLSDDSKKPITQNYYEGRKQNTIKAIIILNKSSNNISYLVYNF